VADNVGEVHLAWPVAKAAIGVLAQCYPRALPFDSVLNEAIARVPPVAVGGDRHDAARGLSATLLQCYAAGLLELHSYRPVLPMRSTPHVLVNPLTRWELQAGRRKLTMLYHRSRVVREVATAKLLLAADGTRDRNSLLDVFATAAFEAGEVQLPDGGTPQSAAQVRAAFDRSFDALLENFVNVGFLLA
jgi:hypothetical protein